MQGRDLAAPPQKTPALASPKILISTRPKPPHKTRSGAVLARRSAAARRRAGSGHRMLRFARAAVARGGSARFGAGVAGVGVRVVPSHRGGASAPARGVTALAMRGGAGVIGAVSAYV